MPNAPAKMEHSASQVFGSHRKGVLQWLSMKSPDSMLLPFWRAPVWGEE
jgi:hypothetical protein